MLVRKQQQNYFIRLGDALKTMFSNDLQTICKLQYSSFLKKIDYICSMKDYLVTIAIACLILTSCAKPKRQSKGHIRGTWILTQITENYSNFIHDFPSDEGTLCRIYESDSIFYECMINTMKPGQLQDIMTASDVTIIPRNRIVYTLIEKDGEGHPLYLEDKLKRPITFPNDTSMTIQFHGHTYTWTMAQGMREDRIEEIKEIIANNLHTSDIVKAFVLPTTERKLKVTNHTFAYIIIILLLTVLLIVHITVNIYQKKQHIEQQLIQINEENQLRPQPVRQAIAEVENNFFHSDFYISLRRRITAGERLKEEDWNEVEQQLKSVWPGFSNRLLGLCQMSEVEFRVCLLTKLHVSPSEMATLLSKDASTISTVRSRLYKKVFQHKGSSKDWDNFILSM